MRLNSMQFDGDGGYDAPLNQGSTAAASAPSAIASQESGAIGAASIASQSGAYKEPGKGAGMKMGSAAKAPKAIDKSNWDRGIKVSQSTIDAVKDAGRGNMGKVPQRTVKNDAIGLSGKGYVGSQMQYNAPVSAEYKEAVKRVYPNEVKSKPSPSFNESSPNAKAFPKIAAPKTNSETVKKLRNKEISDANNKGTALNDRVAYNIINGLKEGAAAYGAGTPTFSQIPGTKTKTAKAQEAAKAERAKSVAAAAKKKK